MGALEAWTHRVVVQHELDCAELHQLPHTAVRERTRVKEKTPPLPELFARQEIKDEAATRASKADEGYPRERSFSSWSVLEVIGSH